MIRKILFFSVLLLLVASTTVHAANLYLYPSGGSYYKSENFTISAFVNTSEAANAISGVLTFPTQYLEVISVRKSNSIINLWVQEPSFSNIGDFGNIRFEGVILNPGFTGGAGKILDIVFKIKKEGFVNLEFIETAILANDGLGTNIAVLSGKAGFVLKSRPIISPEKKTEDVEEQELTVTSTPPLVIIKEVKPEPPSGVLGLWDILPVWTKTSILALVGVAVILLGLIVVSLGVIVLIWIWSYAWRGRSMVESLFASFPRAVGRFTRRAWAFMRGAEREIEGDIKYSVPQLGKLVRKAQRGSSLKQLIKDYFNSVRKIVKRFTTKNEKWQKSDIKTHNSETFEDKTQEEEE